MLTTTHGLHFLIAKEIARTASASIDPNSANYIADGEIVITDGAGTVLDTTTVATKDEVRIAQRSGNNIIWSPAIRAKEISQYKGAAFSAAVEQITYVGFNGTAGAIDTISENDYLVRVIRQDTQATYLNKEQLKFGSMRSDASATQEEIATGVTSSLIANFAQEPEREIKFERVINNAGAAVAQTATPTYKSTLVVMSAANAFVAGDHVRFGTAVTDPTYKVASKSGNDLVLDIPFQGTSGTGLTVEIIVAATAATADFGVKMSGLPRKFERGVFKYSKVRFEVTLAEFGTTGITFDTAAVDGTGTTEEVQEREWFASEGIHGKIERIGTPPPVSKQDADSAKSYSLLYIKNNDASVSSIQGSPKSQIEVQLALDKGIAGAGFGGQVATGTTAIINVLDAWAAAKGFGSAQAGNI